MLCKHCDAHTFSLWYGTALCVPCSSFFDRLSLALDDRFTTRTVTHYDPRTAPRDANS